VTPPRGLSAEEHAAWARVSATVRPMAGTRRPSAPRPEPVPGPLPTTAKTVKARPPAPPVVRPTASIRPAPSAEGLDSHWDRRFRAGAIEPDFTLDLHGHTLDSAHGRLNDGLTQAKSMGARVVLLIAGKSRPAPAADRAGQRGAIRAKLLDWLAAGPHGPDIAAIRAAHRRHGGEGALYLILRRRR
jgi:DNA-nicking Smr family endonuclease